MLKVLMGDYPVTRQFKTHTERFAFETFKGSVASQFKRVVRDLEFDVSEMAIMTHLIAKAHGKPYRLLPVVVMTRSQHPFLVFDTDRNPSLTPEGLEGKRVGVRSYSVTTGAWMRGILMEEHGVDIARINWVTFEEAHVAEFRDPPNVQRAPAGKDLKGMLLAGELDAAILGEIPGEGNLRPLIRDPEGAAGKWREKHGAIQLNHLVVVKDTVSREAASEVYELLVQSKQAAGSPALHPHGLEANRRNLEVAIECAHRQGMIPRRFSVEELL